MHVIHRNSLQRYEKIGSGGGKSVGGPLRYCTQGISAHIPLVRNNGPGRLTLEIDRV